MLLDVHRNGGVPGKLQGAHPGPRDQCRQAPHHGIEERQAKALVKAGKGQHGGVLVETCQGGVVDVAQDPDAAALRGPLAVPARPARDNQGRRVGDRGEGGNQAAVVLARLQCAHGEDGIRLQPAGGARGGKRRRPLGYRVDAVGEARIGIGGKQVRTGRERWDEDCGRVPEGGREHRPQVGTLLPGHFVGPQPEGEVVDEERAGRAAGRRRGGGGQYG